jgi:hypothetical protein
VASLSGCRVKNVTVRISDRPFWHFACLRS